MVGIGGIDGGLRPIARLGAKGRGRAIAAGNDIGGEGVVRVNEMRERAWRVLLRESRDPPRREIFCPVSRWPE